tara:strand:- start:35 stop:436 length:402 start_codon:yes stop_codon:yes gene_type:complete
MSTSASVVNLRYVLERVELEKDDEGNEPSQFYLTKDDERLYIGKSALAKSGQHLHRQFGWSSASPRVRSFLEEHVRYRPSDIVIATFPKCGTTLTEQVVLLLLNGGDAAALDPLSKNSANLTGGLGKVSLNYR